MDKSIYNNPDVPMRYTSRRKMPSVGMVLKWLDQLKAIHVMKSDGVNVQVANDKKFLWKDYLFNLNNTNDKDDFYATMMDLSMTHWISAVVDGLYINLYLMESKDGDTNITPEVLDTICEKAEDMAYKSTFNKMAKWEAKGIYLSA